MTIHPLDDSSNAFARDLHNICNTNIDRLHTIREKKLPVDLIFKESLDHTLRAFLSSTSGTPLGILLHPHIQQLRSQRVRPQLSSETPNHDSQISRHLSIIANIRKNAVNVDFVAKWLADGYSILNARTSAPLSAQKTLHLPDLCYSSENLAHERIQQLSSRFQNMGNHIHGLYLHGSYATQDAIHGFSDLDAACIISRSTCSSVSALLDLRKQYLRTSYLVYSLDAQQHHELFVLSETELFLRTNSYYPDILWNEAKRLCGRSTLELSTAIRDPESSAITFYRLSSTLLSFLIQPKLNNWYSTKVFLCVLALLPALYYQAYEIEISKPDAISRIQQEFEDTGIISLTTQIREEWNFHGKNRLPGRTFLVALRANPQITRMCTGMRAPTPDWALKLLGSNYLADTLQLLAILVDNISQQIPSKP